MINKSSIFLSSIFLRNLRKKGNHFHFVITFIHYSLTEYHCGYALPIDSLFTDLSGNYVCTIWGYRDKGNGKEKTRKLSDQFILYTEPAQDVTKAEEAQRIPKVLKDIYSSILDLIKDIKEKLANGEFKGEDGRDGKNGLVIPTRGVFSLFINDDGHLIVVYNSSDSPPSLYIDESGHLIFGERDGDQQ